MRKGLAKSLSIVLAASLTFTSVNLTAFAGETLDSESEITVLEDEQEAAQEAALEESLREAVSDEEHPGGVFGFYETIMNADEGEELVISVVRQGSTDQEASVVFKAVDVSAEYGKDYTISVEKGFFGDKDLPAAKGVRPLVEEYGEIVTQEDVEAGITVEEPGDAIEEDAEQIDILESELAGEEEEIVIPSDDADEEGAKQDSTSSSLISNGNSLANLYSLQTGEKAPDYDWKEYSTENVSEETKNAMTAGWDESRENLRSLPGVTVKLTFAPGEYKKEIKVKVKDDTKSESGEVVLIELQDAEGAEIGDSYNGYVNITDNDGHEDLTYSVREKEIRITPDDYIAAVTIERHSGIDQIDFVSVGTEGIDAEPDIDYRKTVTELFFAAGITERTIEIPITSNRAKESHFWVGLTSKNGTVEDNNACLVTIEADPEYDTRYATYTEDIEEPASGSESGLPEAEAEFNEVERLGAPATTEVTVYSNPGGYTHGWNDDDMRKICNVDLTYADYVKVKYHVWGYTYNWLINNDREKKVALSLWNGSSDIQSRHYKEFQPPESDSNRVEYWTHEWTRGENENWNCKHASVWYKFWALDGTHNDDVCIVIDWVVVGYNKYKFTINNNYNSMGQYQEKKYKAMNSYDKGTIVKYQKAYFNDSNGTQSTEINVISGDTVSTSREAKGDTPNSQGVYAENNHVNFKGYKIVKPSERGVLSNDLLPASFKVDNAFKVKYKDYMYSNGTFELVPIYEPKKVTVTFNNSNATVSGKTGVKGRFNGFNDGAVLEATMLDSLNIQGVANNGYGITSMVLEKTEVYHYSDRKNFDKYIAVTDNTKQSDPNSFVTRLNVSGHRTNYANNRSYYSTDLRLTINYDSSSITVAPNPQSKNKAKNGNILYVDSVVTDESSQDVGKMVKGGGTLKLEGTSINKAYTFGSIPDTGYHTFWKDGTLDRDGDGIVNDDNPFYKSFRSSYGQSIRYVTKIPLSKIYYNFVKEIDVSEQLSPIPIRGWLKLSDKMLISGTENTIGLNDISVYSDGIEATTKYGGYGDKKGDGYYELDGDGHFYDVFDYSVTFSGMSPYGDVATMAVQNPGRNEDIVIETWKDVDVTDVRLFQYAKNKKGDYEYQAVDTSGIKSGYYGGFTDGDYNYRIQMTAHRNGVNIDKAEISFYNKDGGAVSIEGTEDNNHSGIFTFDFNPAKKGIKAGATARVTFSSGTTKFLSRDVGILIKASLGVVNIVNFLVGGDTSTAKIDIIGAVNSAIDMGWSGNVDNVTVTGDAYEDQEGNKVIKVGIGKNIVDKATKDPLLESAREAAESAKEVGKANSKVAKLESKHSKASEAEKAKLDKEIAAAKKELEDKKKEAADNKEKFDNKFKDAQDPQKNKPKFGNSFTMDLGFSFLMTCGYDYDTDQWYFKNMILTGTLDAAYKFTMNYATPVGVTIGIGLTLSLKASASFVIEQRYGYEDNKDYRYYISNKDIDVLNSDGDDPNRKLDNRGLFSINPSISLTLTAGIAGDLIKVSVTGTAEFNMVFGTKSDSAGACTLSASISISALIFTFSKELTNKTFQLWGDEDTLNLGAKYSGQIMQALGESGDSFLYESIDAFEAEDVSYMAAGLDWYGGSEEAAGEFEAIDEGGMAAYRESPLADKIAANADFRIISLGKGTFAAVFLNTPKNRIDDSNNAKAAYYTYYDGGSWSLPELIEDDQTLDQYPHIYSLGTKGAFIVWSSVNTKYKDTENKLERQNALDIHGRFVKADGTLSDNIEVITKTTEDEAGKEMGLEISDFAADKTFGVFVNDDKMVVCYEKRQYANKDSADATVGDMMYPVSSLIATRAYDFGSGKWAEGTESLESLPGLMALGVKEAQERVEAYNANVYGQKFVDYLPKAILIEDLEEKNGYYRNDGNGTTAIALEDSSDGLLLDSDACVTTIAGKEVGVVAYTVDADGDMDTLSDRQLYMLTYDMEKDEFGEPVALTGYEINGETGEAYTPESSNPRLINAEGGLYLIWLRKENILGLNVSYIIENEQQLVKTGTYDSVSYRYIDKTRPTGDSGIFYKTPKVIVDERIADTEDTTGTVTGDIHEFDAATDGKYIYIVWPEASEKDPEEAEETLTDTQMWCVRVETIAGEGGGKLSYTTNPVQITSYPENNYDDVAFGVVDGKMVGIARKVPSRIITEAEAKEIFGEDYREETFAPYAVWDDAEAYPVSFWVDPASVARIKKAGIYNATAGEGAAFSFEVLNDGFDDLTGAKVSATDRDGNSLLEEAEVTVPDLIGGSSTGFAGYLPLDKSATEAEVVVTLTTKEGVRSSVTLHEDLSPDLSLQKLAVTDTGERGIYRVTGVVDNTGTASCDSGNVQIYIKKDDAVRNLARVSYPSLAPGESYDIDAFIDVADEDFTETTQIVDMATGEVIEEASQDQKVGLQVTETLNLYASYVENDETIEQEVYLENADEEVREFITRSADPQEMSYIDAVTGVVVEAVKAVEKDGETVSEVVSAGKGLITLEKGEKVNLKAAIESSLAGNGYARDEDGNLLAEVTGAENLTYRYEFIGDEGDFDDEGWFIADKTGTGKLKVYVYPADREYSGENYIRLPGDELDGQYSFARMAEGLSVDTFYDYPARAIKIFTLDLEVLESGERDAEEDYTYFTDSKGIIYRRTSKTEAAVCGIDVNKTITSLEIPATVKKDGKTYKVTRIDANAFMNNKLLKSVTIGKYVKDIRSNAFSGCAALTKVKFGSSVESIGDAAFKDCKALKNFTLPSKLKKIYTEAFMDCDSITAVTIPAEVIYIGERAFYGCDKLRSVNIKAENLTSDQLGRNAFAEISKDAVFKFSMKNAQTKEELSEVLTEEGETFKDKKGIIYKLISVEKRTASVYGLTPEAKLKLKKALIPAEVEYMGNKYSVIAVEKNAFAENNKLTAVTFPKTLQTIKDGAFMNAKALKKLKLSENILKVGEEAFSGCIALKQVTIAGSDTKFGENAFNGVPDKAVFKVTTKNEVSRERIIDSIIGDTVSFTDSKNNTYDITNLKYREVCYTGNQVAKNIKVPDTVKFRGAAFEVREITESAFAGNTQIKSVTIGKYVGGIGENAFKGCTSLKKVKMKNVVQIEEEAFAGCTSLNSLSLSKSVEYIGVSAFANCTSLKSLTVPANVRTIDDEAFYKCSSLKKVTIKSDWLVEVGINAFGDNHPSATYKISDKKKYTSYKQFLIDSGVDAAKIR